MVARYVRDVEVPGSNPGSPTSTLKRGTIRCPFSYLQGLFEMEKNRLELLRRLNEIPAVQIDPGRINGFPKIPFAALKQQDQQDQFLEAIEWAINLIRSGE